VKWPVSLGALLDRPSRALLLALGLLVLAVVMPPISLPRETNDAIVVFDITQSMNVEDQELDGEPVSRLAFARESARRALRDLPCGTRIGWGAFAEYRTLLLLAPIEVCAHYNDLLAALDQIDGRMRWGNASQVTKGVFWAVRAAKEIGSAPDVVFVTDGQEAPPLRSTDMPAFDDVTPGEVRGWLIGVGGHAPRPIPWTDEDGRRSGFWRAGDVVQLEPSTSPDAQTRSGEHLSSLREPHLRSLARYFGFEYARLAQPTSLVAVLRDPRFARRKNVPTALHALPVALALCLMLVSFRPDRRWTRGADPAALPAVFRRPPPPA
jgi:mxaL protein